MTKLKLTNKELDLLINNKLHNERFEKLFDDIPVFHPDHDNDSGERSSDYIEDDGRQYRWYIFKDKMTGLEYCLNYTYNIEWPNDLIQAPDSIEIVKNEEDSDLYVSKTNVEKSVPIHNAEVSDERKSDEELWNNYQKIKNECKKVELKEKLNVPVDKIASIFDLIYSKKFNMIQLRSVIIPVCIDYRLDDVSFWHWIQLKTSKGLKATSVVNKKYKLETETEKLWKEYIKIKDQCFKIEKNEKLLISRNEIKPVIDFINGDKEFHIDDLRKMTIPLCIKYKFEDESFLSWLSEKAYSWKK